MIAADSMLKLWSPVASGFPADGFFRAICCRNTVNEYIEHYRNIGNNPRNYTTHKLKEKIYHEMPNLHFY